MMRKRIIAKSSIIEFPSFSNQSVNAGTKSKQSGAFALNHQYANKQIHRVRNFRNRRSTNDLIAATIFIIQNIHLGSITEEAVT